MKMTMFLWILIGLVIATGSTATAAPPNVLIILTDDQGYGDFSCHGNPILKTPQLDELHSQSVRLTDFHVAPMCTPTRGQLLTGRHCLVNGAMNVSSGRTLLRRSVPTLADYFSHAGYRTGHFGKWHLGDNFPFRPADRGFDESIFFPSSHISSAPDYFTNHYFNDVYIHNNQRQQYAGFCTDIFFSEAQRWIAAGNRQQPFFCYIPLNAAHHPLFIEKRYWEPFLQQGLDERTSRFFGTIVNIDENVGKLMTFLEEQKLADNTIVVFMTDNGGTDGVKLFNAGMRGRKIQLYEGGHRVPCFFRWPGGDLLPPCDISELSQSQDLVPTLLDLCGIDAAVQETFQPTFDGLSLAGLLRGKESSLPDRTLFIQFSRMQKPVPVKGDACVLWQRWRLVRDEELFNLDVDFAQKTNVIEEHPEIAERMRQQYRDWWNRIAPGINQFEAIHLGDDAENPLLLSPADWEDVFLDQGFQVRTGVRRNGSWNVEFVQDGEYEISLRRWPVEADMPIRAEVPSTPHTDGQYRAGVSLPVYSARLEIGQSAWSAAVGPDDHQISFRVTQPAGRTKLRTTFFDDQQQEIAGAYYVTVKRISP